MNSSLQYYIHDEPNVLRFELAGSLSGACLESVNQAWHTSLSILGSRPLIMDITFVIDADEQGRAVLEDWHRSGARFIAASPESRALAEAVLGERAVLETIPMMHLKQSWLERLRGFVRGATVVQHALIGRRARH